MSEDENDSSGGGEKDFLMRNRKYILSGVLLLAVAAVVVYLVHAGWIVLPFGGDCPEGECPDDGGVPALLIIGLLAAALVLGLVLHAVQRRLGISGPDWFGGGNRLKKLSEREAYELLRYSLIWRGIWIGRIIERGDDYVGGDDDDATHIYQLEFERRYRDERVVALMNMEQPVEFTVKDVLDRDWEAVDAAMRSLQNVKVVRETTSRDFRETVQEKREAMGRIRSGEIVNETVRPDGSIERTRRRGKFNTASVSGNDGAGGDDAE